jgi:uncharacterized protein (TIGR02444 family)
MKLEHPEHGKLWDFALAIYAEAGFAPSCIHLQDDYCVDVCVLIAMLYAERAGLPVDRQLAHNANQLVASWRTEVVHPIRAARRAVGVKRHDDADFKKLYAQLKANELTSEHVELDMLERWLIQRVPVPHEPNYRRVLERVIATFSSAPVADETSILIEGMAQMVARLQFPAR